MAQKYNERTSNIKQSRVLTVREVKVLEALLFSEDVDPVDRCLAGVVLFQIYSRARLSDTRNLSRFEVDINGKGSYLEARTLDHKVAKRVGGLGQFLVPWGKEFLKERVGVKLSEGRRGPLLPRLLPSGEWSGKAISASKTAAWLNGLLEKGLGTSPVAGLTSRGMKPTSLSWMTKAGYPESSCLILEVPVHLRQRCASETLRELCECLSLIKKGIFVPDATQRYVCRARLQGCSSCVTQPSG